MNVTTRRGATRKVRESTVFRRARGSRPAAPTPEMERIERREGWIEPYAACHFFFPTYRHFSIAHRPSGNYLSTLARAKIRTTVSRELSETCGELSLHVTCSWWNIHNNDVMSRKRGPFFLLLLFAGIIDRAHKERKGGTERGWGRGRRREKNEKKATSCPGSSLLRIFCGGLTCGGETLDAYLSKISTSTV